MADECKFHAGPSCIFVFVIEALFVFVDCFASWSCLLKFFEMIFDLSCWLPQTLVSNPHLVGKYCEESHNQFIHWDVDYCLRWFLLCLVEFLSSLCLFQNSCLKPLPQTTTYDFFFVLLTSSLLFVCIRTLFSWPLKFVETLALASNPCLKPPLSCLKSLFQTTTYKILLGNS